MKKLLKVLCMVMSVLVILSFVSCNKEATSSDTLSEGQPFIPTDAASLWNKIDETMNSIDSYEVNSIIKMSFFSNGSKIIVSGDQFGLCCKGDDYYSYIYSKTEMSCDEPKINDTYETIEAYYDGKMYVYTKDAKYEQKLYSKMTSDDYIAYGDELDIFKDIDLADCKDPEFSKNEDETYSIKFSGYTKKTVNSFLDNMAMPEEELGADIIDVEINISTDTQFHAKKMEFKFVFEEGEDALTTPEFTATNEYSKFNEAKPNPEDIKTEDYVEVNDVRILKRVEDGINDLQNATSGSFTLNIKQDIKLAGQTSSVTEDDTVSYGVENGSYYYDITAISNNVKTTIKYKCGIQTISTPGYEDQVASLSEEAAKEVINSLINTAGYTKEYVSGVTKVDDEKYKIEMGYVVGDEYQQYFESIGAKYKSASLEMVVYSQGDRINKIEGKLKVKGTYNSENLEMTINSTLSIKDVTIPTVDM